MAEHPGGGSVDLTPRRSLLVAAVSGALVGWLVFGPRRRVTGRVVLLSLVFPVLWLLGTLTVGAVSGWYPYPFLDVDEQGAAPVAVACLGVLVLLVALLLLGWLLDRRLPGLGHPADAGLVRTGR